MAEASAPANRYVFSCKTVEVEVEQLRGVDDGTDEDMTGDLVWPTAYIFCKYLCDNAHLVHGRHVVDLGAGTGLVGLVAGRLGAKATFTDVPRVMPLLEHNLALAATKANVSTGMDCAARPLMWGDQAATTSLIADRGPFDVVLCCEIVYQHPPAVAELLRATLTELVPQPGGLLIFAYQYRDGAEHTDAYFFENLKASGFEHVETTQLTDWDDSWDDNTNRTVRIYKKTAGT